MTKEFTSTRISVERDANIYVRIHGTGKPVIFVPGWTFDHTAFEKQIDEIPSGYRYVLYDPRGHGRSTSSFNGNTYEQHGRDLNTLMTQLDLTEATLVAWSYGANAAYSYLRDFGFDRVEALVILDEPPKPASDETIAWGEGDIWTLGTYLGMLGSGHGEFMSGYAPQMFSRELSPEELDHIIGMTEKTPGFVAASLFANGAFADWRDVLTAASKTIRVWNVVRSEHEAVATEWLNANAPGSKISIYTSHMMMWEFPDRFNTELCEFLVGS